MTPARDSRRARRQTGLSVALFPFLAVLVCTMGALIVVLVVLARQAKTQAAEAAATKAAQWQEDLTVARDMTRWRISALAESRQRAQDALAQARLELGHVEDHARQLREQVNRLQAELEELDRAGSQSGRSSQQLQAERERLQSAIAAARRRLEEAELAARQRRKSYAIVPYEGPSGTRRRPIYIECRADKIVLQPEGVTLVDDDFQEPLHPNSALERAVRAARETLLAQGTIKGDGSDEPYPLLLVRPDGVAAYYAARAALKSWKSEIGYELVGEDWELAFAPADPHLAASMREAVAQARAEQRQQALLSAMASGARPRAMYRAAPGGGLIREELPDASGPSGSRASNSPAGPARGTADRRSAPPAGQATPGPARAGAASGGPRPAPVSDSARPAAQAAPRGTPLRPGEWIPQDTASRTSPAKDAAATKDEGKDPPEKTKRLADTRGADWGLPNAAKGSVGITRPIVVQCYPDRLEILADANARSGKIVALPGRTEHAVDELVSAVWEHMKGWGIAGRGMYWRPILRVHVATGAETRFAELQALLEGSGLELQRHEAGRAEASDRASSSALQGIPLAPERSPAPFRP